MFKKYLIVVLATVLLFLFVVWLSSCIAHTPPPNIITTPVSVSANTIIQSIKSSDWLNSLFLLSIVISLAAAFNGLKLGWGAAAACIAGLLLKGALSNVWVYSSLGCVLVGCIGLFAVSVIRKNTALVEIIKGAQNLKRLVNDNDASAVLAAKQSKTTQNIVNTIKNELKAKDII